MAKHLLELTQRTGDKVYIAPGTIRALRELVSPVWSEPHSFIETEPHGDGWEVHERLVSVLDMLKRCGYRLIDDALSPLPATGSAITPRRTIVRPREHHE